MLVDTDVLVWFMRGHTKAAEAIDELTEVHLSAVTYIELVQGLRNKQELGALRSSLKLLQAQMLPVTEGISHKAIFYVEQHFHSHSLRLADALIAATAVEHALPLLTANAKHYKPVSDVDVRRFRPGA